MNALVKLIPPESWLWDVLERWRWVPVFLILLGIAQCAQWAFDRDPPFTVVSYQTAPAKPGGVLVLDAVVNRDLHRECYVDLSNSIIDAIGVRWDWGTTQTVTPQGIRELDSKTPGRLIRKIQLPLGMSPGPASLLSSMTYRCNPLHDVARPISVDARFDFLVQP